MPLSRNKRGDEVNLRRPSDRLRHQLSAGTALVPFGCWSAKHNQRRWVSKCRL